MRRLILHVGHGKTGTSYIQSSLALSKANLKASGIIYPDHASHSRAAKGHISSGNIVTKDPSWVDQVIEKGQALKSDHALLYSYEGIFSEIATRPEVLDTLSKHFSVNLVLFIRDPFEHALSSYGQLIKRHGSSKSFDDFARSYFLPPKLEKFFTAVDQRNVELKVINYSRHRKSLLELFAKNINVKISTLTVPPVENINRSLNNSELYIQMMFNKYYGSDSSRFVSDVLCNKLPEIKSSVPFVSRSTYDSFVEKSGDLFDALNKKLDEENQYLIPEYDKVNKNNSEFKEVTLSFEQVDTLIASISKVLRKGSSESVEVPVAPEARVLKNVAKKIRRKEELNNLDARKLNEIAKKL